MNAKQIAMLIAASYTGMASASNSLIDSLKTFERNCRNAALEIKMHNMTRKALKINGQSFKPTERGTGVDGDCFYNAVGISRNEILEKAFEILDKKRRLPEIDNIDFIDTVCRICGVDRLSTEAQQLFKPAANTMLYCWTLPFSIRSETLSTYNYNAFAQFIRNIPDNVPEKDGLLSIAEELEELQERISLQMPAAKRRIQEAFSVYEKHKGYFSQNDQECYNGFFKKLLTLLNNDNYTEDHFEFGNSNIVRNFDRLNTRVQETIEDSIAKEIHSAYIKCNKTCRYLNNIQKSYEYIIGRDDLFYGLIDVFKHFSADLSNNIVDYLNVLGIADRYIEENNVLYTTIPDDCVDYIKKALHAKVVGLSGINHSRFKYNITMRLFDIASVIAPKLVQPGMFELQNFHPWASGLMPKLVSIVCNKQIRCVCQDATLEPDENSIFDAHCFSEEDENRETIYIQLIPRHFRFLQRIND